ncbi:MAG: glycoside hydrolase family 2 TIM barrel-domain containing protein [Ferruginibacter sp.]
MRRIFLVLFLFVTAVSAGQSRYQWSINDNWKFLPGGLEYADNNDFDDAAWQHVNLPHTWNAADPFDDDETYERGIGWYRKTIEIDRQFENKKIFLFFEGVNQVTDVYVNGAFAGQHKGGYTAFSIDITAFLNWKNNNKNLIAVQVNNAHDNFIAPLSVGYALYGGIYRNAWIIATDKLHYKEINNGAAGIFLNATDVNQNSAKLSIRTNVMNESPGERTFTFSNKLTDASGKLIATLSKQFTIEAGQEVNLGLGLADIDKPHLWSPEDPYLYEVTSQLIENNIVVEEVKNSLGFRWFRFDADSGFFLNGKKYELHGTNRHQDMEGKGAALSNEDHLRDMQLIKNMGCNFVRLAHYPQAPEVLNLADKLGLIIWEEIPVVNYMTIAPEFLKNAENMLREMIHQHFNHPSIVVWGSMNEILLHSKQGDRIQKQDDSNYVVAVRKYALSLDSMIRSEDPSRYTTMAMHGSDDYSKYKLDNISQLAGHNIYDGWYSGKVESFGTGLDKLHSAKPRQVIFVSEYGAEGEVRLNSESAVRMDYTGQYQQYFHEAYLRQIKQRLFLAGTAVWNEMDFSQPNIGGPQPHRNQKGLVTWDRKPKDVYYLYKANWNPEPMIYIASRNWLVRSGESTAASSIKIYSNLEEVTLYVNGKSQQSKKTDDIKKAVWQVQLANGKNLLSAIGKKNGKVISDELTIEYRAYDPETGHSKKPFESISVNVGSGAQYLDASGNNWIEDRNYIPGSFGHTGGKNQFFSRTKVIKSTDDEPLYYSYLDSLQTYRFDVKDGTYQLTLYFVEPNNIKAGQRVFDVSINGKKVLDHLDLANEFGWAQAIKKTFVVDATDSKGINILFNALKGNTILNGIKLDQ